MGDRVRRVAMRAPGLLPLDLKLRGYRRMLSANRELKLPKQVISTVEALGCRALAITRQGLQNAATLDPAIHFDHANRAEYVLDFIFLPA